MAPHVFHQRFQDALDPAAVANKVYSLHEPYYKLLQGGYLRGHIGDYYGDYNGGC